jgi:Mn2+/Fe2+ NRAMP family transporter
LIEHSACGWVSERSLGRRAPARAPICPRRRRGQIVAFGRLLEHAALYYLAGIVVVAATLVLIPGAPLVPILFLSQALNAVLLLVLLPFMRRLARDPAVMGPHAIGPTGRLLTGAALALVAASVAALVVLTLL